MIRIVKPGHELLTPPCTVGALLQLVERAGRVCYKSEHKIQEDTADRFIKAIVKSGHESVIEHGTITVKIICDRSCSHQLVRHRIAAYSQESQRYCDYSKTRGSVLRVICPPRISDAPPERYWRDSNGIWKYGLWERGKGLNAGESVHTLFGNSKEGLDRGDRFFLWLESVSHAYAAYQQLRKDGVPAEDARSVLPNATKTEVVTTFNLRQWRHVFKERALNRHAQWQIREIMLGILEDFNRMLPAVFGDLAEEGGL